MGQIPVFGGYFYTGEFDHGNRRDAKRVVGCDPDRCERGHGI